MSMPAQGRGRPRHPGIDRRLLSATREVLADVGYVRLTVDAVAARAGVGKGSIYRRYASRTELILAALFADDALAPRADAVDTGSLAGDLGAEAATLLTRFGDPVARAAVPGLLVDLTADEASADRARVWFVESNLADIEEYLRRERARQGVESLGDGDDARLVHATLIGTVFAWVGMLQWTPESRLAERIGNLVAAGVTAGPA